MPMVHKKSGNPLTRGRFKSRGALEKAILVRRFNRGMAQEAIANDCMISQQVVSSLLSAHRQRGAGI